MKKANLLVLCALLSIGFLAKAQQSEVHKAPTATTSSDRTSGKNGLLADQLEIKKKISNHRRLREIEQKRQLEQKALQDPSEDLYGDDSWTSHVNPFAGQSVSIPETYSIDLDGFVPPVDSRRVTSHYGYRASFGRMHYGTDIGLSIGDTVRACFSGKVRVASYEGGGYGHYLVIRHTNGLETVYGHLSRRIATEGTVVQAGDPIGLGGNTGRSTGPHLHFEARFMGIPLNPSELFDFHLGAPRLDHYAFSRSAHTRQINASATRARRDAERLSAEKAEKDQAQGKEESQIKTHRVAKGETLYSLARKYDTSVSELRKLNGLRKDRLTVGKSIRVA